MIYLKIETALYAVGQPIYVRRQSNGTIVRCDSETKAQGLVSPDGTEIWQLADRAPLGADYPTAQLLTYAEYEELLSQQTEAPDPEDTEPEIPEGGKESAVLTRAELTEKVYTLEEELAAAKILLGVQE